MWSHHQRGFGPILSQLNTNVTNQPYNGACARATGLSEGCRASCTGRQTTIWIWAARQSCASTVRPHDKLVPSRQGARQSLSGWFALILMLLLGACNTSQSILASFLRVGVDRSWARCCAGRCAGFYVGGSDGIVCRKLEINYGKFKSQLYKFRGRCQGTQAPPHTPPPPGVRYALADG